MVAQTLRKFTIRRSIRPYQLFSNRCREFYSFFLREILRPPHCYSHFYFFFAIRLRLIISRDTCFCFTEKRGIDTFTRQTPFFVLNSLLHLWMEFFLLFFIHLFFHLNRAWSIFSLQMGLKFDLFKCPRLFFTSDGRRSLSCKAKMTRLFRFMKIKRKPH